MADPLSSNQYGGWKADGSIRVAPVFYSDQAGEWSNISLLTFKAQSKVIFYAGVTISFGSNVLTLFIFLT